MDIQTEFSKRKLLKNSTAVYDLTKCRWKSVNNQHGKKKQITNPSTQGYMHASAILKNSLYVIAGPDQHYPKQSMHSYNFKTYEWKHWKDCVLPPPRDSFGLTTHKNEMYLFGGSTNDRHYGDTHIFSNFTSNWREYQGSSPSPRTPMIFSDVGNQYVLCYGGANFQTETILEDAYIFYRGQWKPLSTKNAPSGLIGAQSAVCRDNLYIFGGELQAASGPATPNDKLYKLVIDAEEMSLQFVAIEVRGRSSPSFRTAHSMVALDKEYFIVLGGISLDQNSRNQILRDIWVFDTEQLSWTSLDPVNGIIKGVASGSLNFNGNALILLGGSVQRLDIWNEQLMMIQFAEDEFFKAEICSNCQLRAYQREKQQKAFPKALVLSAGFFYNLSLQYKHPFQAIAALYQSSTIFHAEHFRVGINKEINENEFIKIGWDGRSLNRQQFQHLICHSETNDKLFNRFVNVLKLASLRLGKTMLFCSNDRKQRKVFLFSADSKVIPEFDDIYGYFAYIENIEKNTIQSHEGRMNKKLILNVLHSRLSDPNTYLTKSGNYLLIFEKNILVTSEKIYYYELISSTADDITVFRNLKKIQFLDELGYAISKEPEVSLSSYVAMFNFHRQLPAFYINSSVVPVQTVDYLSILKNMEDNAKVRALQVRGASGDVEFESWLYIADQPDVILNNFGVMIYFQGILVNRLDGQFGQLFKQLFYKTKFKSALTTFEFMGVINIRRGLQLTFLRNDFRRDKAYFEFMDVIRGTMKNGSSEKMNKRARIQSEDMEQRK